MALPASSPSVTTSRDSRTRTAPPSLMLEVFVLQAPAAIRGHAVNAGLSCVLRCCSRLELSPLCPDACTAGDCRLRELSLFAVSLMLGENEPSRGCRRTSHIMHPKSAFRWCLSIHVLLLRAWRLVISGSRRIIHLDKKEHLWRKTLPNTAASNSRLLGQARQEIPFAILDFIFVCDGHSTRESLQLQSSTRSTCSVSATC